MPRGLERAQRSGDYVWTRDGSTMVFVPPGPFVMGTEEARSEEASAKEVWLGGFYIDKHEVSWRRWKRSGLAYTTFSGSRLPHPEAPDWGIVDDHPVVNVDWYHAGEYAEWAGKRLPTEAEWEKAARGTDGRDFPWGDEPPTADRAVWRGHPIAETSTAPVDCCEAGASPYGALNMAGNVYEWCADRYGADGRYRVLRGGALVHEEDDLRSALRYRLYPRDRAPYIGFRTVLSASLEGASPAEGARP